MKNAIKVLTSAESTSEKIELTAMYALLAVAVYCVIGLFGHI